MDRYLKERLVGAAVLVAAANILIPPMLSGPHDGAPASETVLPSDAPVEANGVKTYTIDLSAAQRDARSQTSGDTDETPSESAAALPTVEVAPAPPPVTSEGQLRAESEPAKAAPVVATTESARTPPVTPSSSSSKPAQATESRARESAKDSSARVESRINDGEWAVQVASFGARATADRIAGELKSKGFKSFVMPVQTKGQTLYRVRVGPVNDRDSAEALLKRVKALHPSAAVVPQ